MTTVHEETERKYDVRPGAELPDLVGGLVSKLGPAQVDELYATYFDTDDLALANAGVSLRRRTGGTDSGWHLKLPAHNDTRIEIRRALGRGIRVPGPLARMLIAATTGRPLSPMMTIHTLRTVRELVGKGGTVIALVADDAVTAAVPGADGPLLQWRELEIELTAGDQTVLDDLDRVLEAAGFRRSSSASKLRRALERAYSTLEHVAPTPALPKKSAGAVVHHYLVEQRLALTSADIAVRATGTSVHDVRVAARRMRAALAVYRSLVDAETARHLQGELRWIGQTLSDIRDLEVANEALTSALDDEPPHRGLRSARTLMRRRLTAAERSAQAVARDVLASERYMAALTGLDAALTAPSWTDRASTKASKTLPRLLAKPQRRLRRAVKAAASAETEDRPSALHEVRKAAKRLRYALEVAEVALWASAGRMADSTRTVQSILGDHLDTVATSSWLYRLGHDPDAGQAAAFTYGRLHARNEERIFGQLDDYAHAVRPVVKAKPTDFLRRR